MTEPLIRRRPLLTLLVWLALGAAGWAAVIAFALIVPVALGWRP